MRITIEVPDSLASSTTAGPLPSVITEPGAVVSATSDAMSGGAGPSALGGGVGAPVYDSASAGAAEQYQGDRVALGPDAAAADGGAAPA
jgi:hypothetical protein